MRYVKIYMKNVCAMSTRVISEFQMLLLKLWFGWLKNKKKYFFNSDFGEAFQFTKVHTWESIRFRLEGDFDERKPLEITNNVDRSGRIRIGWHKVTFVFYISQRLINTPSLILLSR